MYNIITDDFGNSLGIGTYSGVILTPLYDPFLGVWHWVNAKHF
jgi:hypothetical protein